MKSSENQVELSDAPVLGFASFRFVVGVNFLMHGAVRVFGDYAGFVSWVTKTFEGTILSGGLAGAYGWAIPLIELILGVLLISGLGTKWTLVAGELFMATLIVGMTLKQNWDTVAFQMIYAISLYLLLLNIRYNHLSLDYLLFRQTE
jgi:thiosulfate dehydrogenase [quinone] large subunit